MTEIRMEGLCKRYGDVSVIEGLNLTIENQEFMVLVGPSGCGKSTILRMIAGLEEISAGTMNLGDRIVNDVQPKDRDVGMVFQSYALYPHMTVRENISFGLKVRKVPKPEIDRLVNEAAAILGLTELLERRPKALSGGQRQRVALGRAIVRKPSVFLFDEPLSNLDAELRVQMRAEISKLQKRLKITSVYVTHDQVEAMTMGHRITVLSDGKIMQVGTPLELYTSPKNVFTAKFIGTPPMNMLEGKIDDAGEAILIHTLRLPLDEHRRALVKGREGAPVFVGIRPEDIGQAAGDTPSNHLDFDAEVEASEPLGHEVIVHVGVGDLRIVAKLPPHSHPRIGDRVHLRMDCGELHLFDRETELRLEA